MRLSWEHGMAFLLPFGAAQTFGEKCETIGSRLNIADTTVWFSELLTAGTNLSLPENNVTCTQPSQLVPVDLCRVSMRVETSDRSELSMEAWLPKEWNGRFLSTGNGGLAGCIPYASIALGADSGFATVGTNNGHNGTSGEAFYNNLETIIDYASRSVHVGSQVGKEVSKTFYGTEHKKSYYIGCSTGGRQGVKSAENFPDDFDGILAGAPAVRSNNIVAWLGSFFTYTGPPSSPTFLTPEEWQLVNQDVLRQCDELDGVADGIIEDPYVCKYDPEPIICTSPDATGCLTPEQASTVRKVYSPLYFPNGTFIYPRAVPGGEGEALMFQLYAGAPHPFPVDWFKYAVYNDPNWDATTIGFDDFAAAIEANIGDAQTYSGDLSRFRDCGGKIITFHGQQDGVLAPEHTDQYYAHVGDTMQLEVEEIDEFYRHFRISGMGHCLFGPGAWSIGQSPVKDTEEPEGNLLTAIVRWVEEGVAPESIQGTKFVNDTVELGVDFRRTHCKYPLTNTYKGEGDPKDPESWECL